MKELQKIYSFEEAFKEADSNRKNKLCTKDLRLLLGNGFSQAYYGSSYTALFNAIGEEKKNERIKKLFDLFGTSNFEMVMSCLKNAQLLSQIYDFSDSEIKKDYERIRDALAEAILKVHPESTIQIPENHKISCQKFLKKFDDIYSVNYDLLLYWVVLQGPEVSFGDYFFRDQDTPSEYCEYFEDGSKTTKHILFLHGALHLFLKNGITTKKVLGTDRPLISQIKSAIESGHYPLVVAEGDSKSKINQIKSNPYLNHAFSKFSLCGGQIFSFGFSFSDQDKHIVDAIAQNKKIRFLWLGIFGDASDEESKRLLKIGREMEKSRESKSKKTEHSLAVKFFDTKSVNIWNK